MDSAPRDTKYGIAPSTPLTLAFPLKGERDNTTVSAPEFNAAEAGLLERYFTNLDRPVFALRNLPEVVKGALFSRYSRTEKSLRRVLLDEFINEPDSGFDRLAGTPPVDDNCVGVRDCGGAVVGVCSIAGASGRRRVPASVHGSGSLGHHPRSSFRTLA